MASYIKHRFLLAIFVVSLISTSLLRVEQTQARTVQAQPHLLELAAQQPTAPVKLIVQTTGDQAAIIQQITALGGTITHNLHLIKAVAATMPAGRVPQLATLPGVRWISQDAQVLRTSHNEDECAQCVATDSLESSYARTIGATNLWNEGPAYLQGSGVTVAVVDSGIYDSIAFSETPGSGNSGANGDDDDDELDAASRARRILAKVKFNSDTPNYTDSYGHGTHIAGVIGGNGSESSGDYIGVAPRVNLLNVKVSDDQGGASVADVVAGLQWVYEHKTQYNIRVVNLSLNSSVSESYHTSPLNAAVEILWFSGIVVVVSAGNNGAANNGILYPPANDPFVISVGATNEHGTPPWQDDFVASYSAYGVTESGFSKPDILAPGTNITSVRGHNTLLSEAHPSHNVGGQHFRMSGTSMAAGVTTGAVALLLQDEPHLTPDQVKHRLLATARPIPMGSMTGRYLDIYAAVHGTTTASSNTGIPASQLLWTGSDAVTWDSVSWNSVSWNSVSWNSVSWNSVSWNSVSWNSVSWDP